MKINFVVSKFVSTFDYVINNNCMSSVNISEEIIEEGRKVLANDTQVQHIVEIDEQIKAKKMELAQLEGVSISLKNDRINHFKKLRGPVLKCAEIDANNPHYFLKNAQGIYNCVGFVAKIELTTHIRQKITITLSSLFKEKKIGRTIHKDMFYYGHIKFFEVDNKGCYSILKHEFMDKLDALLDVTV